ncbi:hypothetical protein [Roseateles sp.]|uniref:hypothetical protein n=1 Tax=Roseateles sp. TaxID=1971397 RepID=UPI00286A93E4|nr:hypothetical protein [Roseateles sp.]
MATDHPEADGKLQGGEDKVQEALKAIPYVGGLLAYMARHMGMFSASLALLILVILPLLVPVLMSAYLRLLPDELRIAYSQWLLGPLAVDQRVTRLVDKAVATVVSDNNLRLDFVQQFQQVWVKDGDWRSPVFAFPLSEKQEFNLDFSAHALPSRSACTDVLKIKAAEKALTEKGLFTISVLGKSYPIESINEPTPLPFGENFWAMAKNELDLLRKERAAKVQVVLNLDVARAALECYPIRSTLLITVNKTLTAHSLEQIDASKPVEKSK